METAALSLDNRLSVLHRELREARDFVAATLARGETVPSRPVNRTLSIGVPVFTRYEAVEQLVTLLCHQISQLPEHILVDVQDNAPGERNRTLLHRLARVFPFLRYRKLLCNNGADVNIASLYVGSETPFRWLIGDDDLLTPGSLAQVAETVERHAGDGVRVFHLGGFVVDEALGQVVSDEIHPTLRSERGTRLLDTDAAVVAIGREFLRMSCNVVRVEPLSPLVQQQTLGQGLSPLCIALNALSHGRCCHVNHPLVVYREGYKADWIALWPQIAHYAMPRLFADMALAGTLPADAVHRLFTGDPERMFGDNATRVQAFNQNTWRDIVAMAGINAAERSVARSRFLERIIQHQASGGGVLRIDCLAEHRALNAHGVGIRRPDGFGIGEAVAYVTVVTAGGERRAGCRFEGIPLFGHAACEVGVWVAEGIAHPPALTVGVRKAGQCGAFMTAPPMSSQPGRHLRYDLALGPASGFFDIELSFELGGGAPDGAEALCAVTRLTMTATVP